MSSFTFSIAIIDKTKFKLFKTQRFQAKWDGGWYDNIKKQDSESRRGAHVQRKLNA